MGVSYLTVEQRERLKKALASGSKLGASHLTLLNTDTYRERLGAEWFKYRGIIEAISLNAIKAQFRDGDMVVPTRHGFALFFFSRSDPDVRTLCDRIAAEVERHLSNEREFRDPPISCRMNQITTQELLRQLEEEAAAPSAKAATSAPAEDAPKVQAVYDALWHPKLERVLGCLCKRSEASVVVPLASDKYYEESAAHMRKDIQVFNRLLGDAFRLTKTGVKAAIFFSINFRSFCTADLHKEYMHALRQAPSNLLPSLTPRFVRIPPGAPAGLISAKTQELASVFKHVALNTSPDADLNRFQFLPNAMLTTAWKDVVKASRGKSGAAAEETLTRFCKTARSLRLSSLVDGLTSRDAFESSLKVGPDFMTGEIISEQLEKPSGQYRLTASDILGNGRSSRAQQDENIVYV